ncbi:hypothetical protein L218DRAFT_990449 [Marasmius fiardii PR-910]|nr:hypothetical protein L218DRAFT_990449 [Marasmius fiardii PR-910]
MVDIPSDAKGLETLVEHQTVVGYFLASGATLFAYDVITNLDAEIEYVWAALDFRKRRIKKAPLIFHLMYLVQRYLPLLDQVILALRLLFGTPNPRACAITLMISAWSSITGIVLSEFILGIRVWAVWRQKRSIGLILVAFTLGFSTTAMAFFERFLKGIDFFEPYMPVSVPLRGCFISVKNKDMYVGWVLLMIYDSAMFILMAIPGFAAYRIGGTSKFVKVVYRDGVMYYAFSFMVSLMNVILILVLPANLGIAISPFLRVLHSLLASHAVLHIREVVSRDNLQVTDTAGKTAPAELSTVNSDMVFAFSSVFPSIVESEGRYLGPEAGPAD